MERPPVISVITIVYNDVNGIEKTISSVLSQTYSHIEYIVIDGGSIDGTLEIIERYNDKIDHWVSGPDKNLYDAMNKGLRSATGDYVLFINSGDEIYHNETLSNIFKSREYADVYYGETMMTDSAGNELGVRSKLSTRKLTKNLTADDFLKGMVVSHQSILVKRTIAPDYELHYSCSSDIDWCIKVLKLSRLTVNSHQIISKFLVGGYSQKNMKKCWLERFKILRTHFGMSRTLYAHIVIALRYLFGRYILGKKY